jgi:hypothetical protein
MQGMGDDIAAHRLLIGNSNAIYAQALAVLQELLSGPMAKPEIVARMERAWRNRTFRASYERPLLLLAAMRHDLLLSGQDHPLAEAFADENPALRFVTRDTLTRALDPDRLPVWLALATRKVQTNDVSRTIAWRWPAALAGGRPIALVDVGCAAGLALVADRLPPSWVDELGRPIAVDGGPVILRQGFDAEPIDVLEGGPDEAFWLRACIWPGDTARLGRLEAAMTAFAAAKSDPVAPQLARVRARHVSRRLRRIHAEIDPTALIIVSQTFVRDYVEPAEAEVYAREMNDWLAETPRGRAVWMQLELTPERGPNPAELVAHPARGEPMQMARCSYHPTTIAVVPSAVEQLRRALTWGRQTTA